MIRKFLQFASEFFRRAIESHMSRVGLLLNISTPTAADFQAGRVTNPNQSEVIRQTLYDFLLYPTAGQVQLNFFSQPAGQGLTSALGAAAGGVKSLADTNLVLPNQLPSGTAFMIESIEVFFYAGSVATANTYTPANISLFAAVAVATLAGQANDVNTIMQSGLLELNVLQKNYLRETPLQRFPQKTGIDGNFAISTNSATTSEVALVNARATGRPYYLDPVVTLQPAVNFEVLIKWPGALATGSGFNGRIGVVLDGYTMRASQ
jgi:hypothetical protein